MTTDGPATVEADKALMSLEEILLLAETTARAATDAASTLGPTDDSVPAVSAYATGVLTASSAGALAQASQAWTALAVARMHAGAKLAVPEDEKDPRAALRKRVPAAK